MRSLENLDVKSDMYGSLLIPMLQTEIPNELSIMISRPFNDPECWNVIWILKVLKEELIAREKLFQSKRNTDLFKEILHYTECKRNVATTSPFFCSCPA